MKIHILAIGKAARKAKENALFLHYISRIRWNVELKEMDVKKKLPPAENKEAENTLLIDALPERARVIVLDEKGKDLSSRQLAKTFEKWQNTGASSVAFVIGGADGITPELRSKADLVLSMGRLTWPHMLVRPMLAEQIFRVQCLLSGHPYHRDG